MSVLGGNILLEQGEEITVHLLDDSRIYVIANHTTKCKHIVMAVAKKLGINNDADFSLFEQRGDFLSGTNTTIIYVSMLTYFRVH